MIFLDKHPNRLRTGHKCLHLQKSTLIFTYGFLRHPHTKIIFFQTDHLKHPHAKIRELSHVGHFTHLHAKILHLIPLHLFILPSPLSLPSSHSSPPRPPLLSFLSRPYSSPLLFSLLLPPGGDSGGGGGRRRRRRQARARWPPPADNY